MSKITLVVTGLVLAAVGFGVGHYVGSSADLRAAPPGLADGEPLRPGEVEDAILEALRHPDAYARAARLATLLPRLGPEAIPEVEAALKGSLRGLGGAEFELLVRCWATHDPKGATEWLFTGAPSLYFDMTAGLVMEFWAKVDPLAAAQHLASAGPISIGASAKSQGGLITGWFASGLPGLEDYIRDLGLQSDEQQRALGVLAREMIKRDGVEAVLSWAESIPDKPHRYKLAAFRRVGSEVAKVDPVAAAAWCDEHCEGPFGNNVRERIAATWAGQDGLAAMQWVSTAPPGRSRDNALRGAFRLWKRTDPEGLRSWVDAMGVEGVEPWFLPAVGLYADYLSWQKEHLEALKWAELMTDDAKRELAIISIARRWRFWDEEAGEAWLQQSPLSEQAREKARHYPKVWTVGRDGEPIARPP